MRTQASVLLLLLLVLPGLVVAGTPWAKLWNTVGIGSGCGCSESCVECEANVMLEALPVKETSSSCCSEVEEAEEIIGSTVQPGCTCGSHPLTQATTRLLLPRSIPPRSDSARGSENRQRVSWARIEMRAWNSWSYAPEPPPPRF